jgi:antirestriction protein ArdC
MKKQHADIYQAVTDRIIAQLEEQIVPWRKPWTEAGHPQNFATGRHYSGINVWLLASAGYARNQFLTFNQARDAGGAIKKGEKGHMVIFWKRTEREAEEGSEDDAASMLLLRHYHVFNVAQCEGLPEGGEPDPPTAPWSAIAACEELVEGMPNCPEIRHGRQQAFYSPANDYVNMPQRESFASPESYYATLFHELVHSTGHASRLSRREIVEPNVRGSAAYSREELVAEIGACYLSSVTGIAAEDLLGNSVAYIAHWLEVLRNDRKLIVVASSRAQKAADYILNAQGRTPPEEGVPEEPSKTL